MRAEGGALHAPGCGAAGALLGAACAAAGLTEPQEQPRQATISMSDVEQQLSGKVTSDALEECLGNLAPIGLLGPADGAGRICAHSPQLAAPICLPPKPTHSHSPIVAPLSLSLCV